MAFVWFDTTFASVSKTLYRVKIHDYTGTGFTREMNIFDLFIETRGDDRDVLDDIKPCRAGFQFYANDVYTRALRDALISEPEGVFYLEILQGSNRLFFGRIIGNSYSQEDISDPSVKVEAIDGLTILKSITYLHPSVDSGFSNLKEIILDAIKKIDTIDRFYNSSDEVLFFASNLNNKIGTIYETTYHANYFYEDNNGKKKYLSFYEVLQELMRKYFLRLHYQDGAYYVIGKETWTSSRPAFNVYYKNGALSRTTTIGNTIDLLSDTDSRMLAGGTYYYEPGYRKAEIIVTKYHLNKNLADGIFWYRGTTNFVVVNTLIANTQYKIRAKVNVNLDKSLYDPAIQYFRLKFYIKKIGETNTTYEYITSTIPPLGVNIEMGVAVYELTTTAGTSLNSIDVLFPFFSPQDFYIDFTTSQANEDKELEIKIEFIGFYDGSKMQVSTIPGLESCYTASFDVGQKLEETENDVIFTATIPASFETEERTIDILACDQYGSALARTYTKFTTGGNFEVSENKWRFGTTGTYTPLERTIVKRMLEIIAKKQSFFQGAFYRKGNFPKMTDYIDYRDKVFFPGTMSWNILSEIVQLTMIYVNDLDTGVVVDEDEPILIPEYPQSDILDPQSPAGGIESLHEDFENVTSISVTTTQNLEFYFTAGNFEQIKRRWKVYVNGIKYKYVDFETMTFPLASGDIQPNEWTADPGNSKIYFPYQLQGDYVEIEYLKI